MRYLLDTHVFLWLAWDSKTVTARAREALTDEDVEIYLSAASAWEIAAKYASGKLRLPVPPEQFVPRQRELLGATSLAVDEASALTVSQHRAGSTIARCQKVIVVYEMSIDGGATWFEVSVEMTMCGAELI